MSSVKNGNKPYEGQPGEFRSEFTARVAAHPRVAYLPIQKTELMFMMVIDELLVGHDAVTHNSSLFNHLNSNARHVGHLLDEHDDSVQIWRLNSTPGDKSIPDVAYAVYEARKTLNAKHLAAQVTPNHVLIPASNFHMCPWGPPEQVGAAYPAPDLGPGNGDARVTVIDAGYVTGGPIDPRLTVRPSEWFSATAGWSPDPIVYVPPGGPVPNPLDQNTDGKLDALVGHANFVAGVVAQGWPEVRIDLVSHNGSFVEADDGNVPIPTEGSVVRSLFETLNDRRAPSAVINVGYSFPPLPWTIPPVGLPPNGPPSWSFASVLNMFVGSPFMLVAPAGNQGLPVPQYPAAFHLAYPHHVVGVGSVRSTNKGWMRTPFSNFGPWVACCTEGEGVVSSFVNGWVGKPTEEGEDQSGSPHPPKSFYGWAEWEGTSFAAPKVAAAIARRVGGGMTPIQAWQNLTSPPASTPPPSPAGLQMGFVLPGLPPVSP